MSRGLAATRSYDSRGLIVRRRCIGEADSLLSLFTPSGKLDCVVRSGQTSRRWSGLIEPLTLIEGRFARGRSLESLRECKVLSGFTLLKQDLDRLTIAGRWCRLVHRSGACGETAASLFKALIWALVELESSSEAGNFKCVEDWLVVRMLSANGSFPRFEDSPLSNRVCEAEAEDQQNLLDRYLQALSFSPVSVCRELELPSELRTAANYYLHPLLESVYPGSLEILQGQPAWKA